MSREQKVGLVNALGAGFEIVKSLVQAVEEMGGNENDVRQLLNPNLPILKEVASVISPATGIVWTGRVEIDHAKTYKQRVGTYGMTFADVPKLYPITPCAGIEKVELAVVRFGKPMEVVEAEQELKRLGVKHSTAEDAIAFGEKYRHVVYKFGTTMSLGDAKFSEPKPPVTDEHIPLYGKIGSKIFFEALCLCWSEPGNLTLSTHQFFNHTWRNCCVLCRKQD